MSDKIIELIRVKHRERNYVMQQRKRSDLSLGAFLRLSLGWRRDLEKEQSDRIKDLADKLIACGEKLAKGKPHELSDTEEWKDYCEIILASIEARGPYDAVEKKTTKEMERLAELLPVWSGFGESTPGLGARSLAVIIGGAGDLSNYSTHSKLWRRMGMAPFTKNGITRSGKQWRIEGGLNAEDWSEFGYSPIRRSTMFVIEESMMKAKGPYREVYLARKQCLRDRAVSNGLTVAPAAKIPAKLRSQFVSLGYIDQDAKRYMGKRLLRDLWKAWRRAVKGLAERPKLPLPADEITDAAQAAGQAMVTVPTRATKHLPDHQLPDAPQGAGEANLPLSKRTVKSVPPHQSRDAA